MAKKIAGLAVVAAVAVIVFPGLLQYAPLLLIAICPLSMLLMGGHAGHMMGGHAGHQASAGQGTIRSGAYTCPMHPEVSQNQPGHCPRCGMVLKASSTPIGDVQELEDRLRAVSDQQAALAAEIERVKRGDRPLPRGDAVQEAEEIARAAERKQDPGQ